MTQKRKLRAWKISIDIITILLLFYLVLNINQVIEWNNKVMQCASYCQYMPLNISLFKNGSILIPNATLADWQQNASCLYHKNGSLVSSE